MSIYALSYLYFYKVNIISSFVNEKILIGVFVINNIVMIIKLKYAYSNLLLKILE